MRPAFFVLCTQWKQAMNANITRHNLFGSSKAKADAKAEKNGHTAKGIVKAEAEARDKKTARLREARLKMAMEVAATDTPDAPTKRKTTRRKQGGRDPIL